MSDASFNSLYQTIQNERPASEQMVALANAFNNTGNYFTSYQASRLIQLVTAEARRLQLAKLSYRSITDRNNFSQVYNLLSYQSSKDELTAYINNYNPGGTNSRIPMTDSDFTSLYQATQMQFFPGERMTALTNVFNKTGNYFTSSQAKQLIQLVTMESNRLQLAKLSYRTITDRGNFSQLYDLFTNQASKDELDAYVKAYVD
jgi:DNA polymerase IIIc chi subunit